MSEQKRRKWTAKEKLRIVLTCLQPGVEISEVCRREGINPTMLYNWKKRLVASADPLFDEKPKKRELERE
jgi:transposase